MCGARTFICAATTAIGESHGGIALPRAPKTVRRVRLTVDLEHVPGSGALGVGNEFWPQPSRARQESVDSGKHALSRRDKAVVLAQAVQRALATGVMVEKGTPP